MRSRRNPASSSAHTIFHRAVPDVGPLVSFLDGRTNLGCCCEQEGWSRTNSPCYLLFLLASGLRWQRQRSHAFTFEPCNDNNSGHVVTQRRRFTPNSANSKYRDCRGFALPCSLRETAKATRGTARCLLKYVVVDETMDNDEQSTMIADSCVMRDAAA